ERAERRFPSGELPVQADTRAHRRLGVPLRVSRLGEPRRGGATGRMIDLLRNSWLRLLGLLLLLAGLFFLLRALHHLLTPFLIAFPLAFFLDPPVHAMERLFERLLRRRGSDRHWFHPRAAAVGILALGVLVVIVVVLLFAVPLVTEQIVDTAKKLPGWIQSLREKAWPLIQSLAERYPD